MERSWPISLLPTNDVLVFPCNSCDRIHMITTDNEGKALIHNSSERATTNANLECRICTSIIALDRKAIIIAYSIYRAQQMRQSIDELC